MQITLHSTADPYGRNYRIQFLPREYYSVIAHIRIRIDDFRFWNPKVAYLTKSIPDQLILVASASHRENLIFTY